MATVARHMHSQLEQAPISHGALSDTHLKDSMIKFRLSILMSESPIVDDQMPHNTDEFHPHTPEHMAERSSTRLSPGQFMQRIIHRIIESTSMPPKRSTH